MQNDKAKPVPDRFRNLKLNSRKETMLLYSNSSNLSMGYPKITFQEDQVINSCEAGQASWVITSKDKAASSKRDFTNYFNIALSPPMKVSCGWRY